MRRRKGRSSALHRSSLVESIASTPKSSSSKFTSSVASTLLRLFYSSIVLLINVVHPAIELKPAHRFAATRDGSNDPVPTDFDYSSDDQGQ
jgi:hypothetical protein